MSDKNIPFTVINWDDIVKTQHPGEAGSSTWQTLQFSGLRVRLVAYSAGYIADHWCRKGHIVHCLEGKFITEQQDGGQITLTKGMSYIVSDELSSHRSLAQTDVKLLIIDGDFLKFQP